MPINTTKRTARHLVDILYHAGVRHAVLSPGSRNTPLIMAFERHPNIETLVVIDERVAAFVALGISISLHMVPVAICCTSGTAPLNYGPALAEAYYRGAPLIAVTADRPEEWIDQDDSQTIRQNGIFANFTKTSVDLPVESDDPDRCWMTDRLINEAVLTALKGRRGPVQINVRLADPLAEEDDFNDAEDTKYITRFDGIKVENSVVDTKELESLFAPKNKVLILAGFMPPELCDECLAKVAELPNVVIMQEAQSNLLDIIPYTIDNIDATLSQTTDEERMEYAPDVVITLGGSLLSRYVKKWLRSIENLRHVAINDSERVVDPFRKLTSIYDSPEILQKLHVDSDEEVSDYKSFWLEKSYEGHIRANCYADSVEWSDFKAIKHILTESPCEGTDLHVSNGTAIRYIQLFDYTCFSSIQCNRGVSGIDGCTSTAIGAATTIEDTTLLITGDMSFAYDIGALALDFIPKNFKIIVLNNCGGGIFRFIPSTANLPELERCFVTDIRLPLAQLAEGYGFRYLRADSIESLDEALQEMWECEDSPVILDVQTPGEYSAEVLRNFFKN